MTDNCKVFFLEFKKRHLAVNVGTKDELIFFFEFILFLCVCSL